MELEVLTVTSKGQISIPVSFRKLLSIDKGTKLVAYTYKDALMLKVLPVPSVKEFENFMDKAKQWAKEVGYSKKDVDLIIKEVRKTNK